MPIIVRNQSQEMSANGSDLNYANVLAAYNQIHKPPPVISSYKKKPAPPPPTTPPTPPKKASLRLPIDDPHQK